MRALAHTIGLLRTQLVCAERVGYKIGARSVTTNSQGERRKELGERERERANGLNFIVRVGKEKKSKLSLI